MSASYANCGGASCVALDDGTLAVVSDGPVEVPGARCIDASCAVGRAVAGALFASLGRCLYHEPFKKGMERPAEREARAHGIDASGCEWVNVAAAMERSKSFPLERSMSAVGCAMAPSSDGTPEGDAKRAVGLALGVAAVAACSEAVESLAVREALSKGRPGLRADSTSSKVAAQVLSGGEPVRDLPAVSLSYPFADGDDDCLRRAAAFCGAAFPAGSSARAATGRVLSAMAGVCGTNQNSSERHRLESTVDGSYVEPEPAALAALKRADLTVPLYAADGETDLGCHVTFSAGGLHGFAHGEGEGPVDGQARRAPVSGDLWSVDFSSYYPHLLLNMGALPESGEAESLFAAKDSLEAQGPQGALLRASVKLVLNSASGACDVAWSEGPLRQNNRALSMRLCGQLLMWVLCERLSLSGCPVRIVNTDGLYCDGPEAVVRAVAEDMAAMVRCPVKVERKRLCAASVSDVVSIDAQGRAMAGSGGQVGLMAGPSPSLACNRPAAADLCLADIVAANASDLSQEADMGAAMGSVMGLLGRGPKEALKMLCCTVSPQGDGGLWADTGDGPVPLGRDAVRALPVRQGLGVRLLMGNGPSVLSGTAGGWGQSVTLVDTAIDSMDDADAAALVAMADVDKVARFACDCYERSWRLHKTGQGKLAV